MLQERHAQGRPFRVGVIGAGKFGTMFLAQARITPGIHILGVADLNVERARGAFQRSGWPAEQVATPSLAAALKNGGTHITDDAMAFIARPVAKGAMVTWMDVEVDAAEPAVAFRREMEATFAPAGAK